MTDTTTIEIDPSYAGPPNIGHGGYVAGLFAGRWPGAIQVTLRRPTPLGVPLRITATEPERAELWVGEDLIADARPCELDLDLPPLPTLAAAIEAEAGSPAHFNQGLGVHPTCFGCGLARPDGDGLRIAVGPLTDGSGPVAGRWEPEASMIADGVVDPAMVAAALDCSGAFAFIVDDLKAGLLGRITFEQYVPLRADDQAIVVGWQIGTDGRKMLAGTALATATGTVVAAASAVWFPFS